MRLSLFKWLIVMNLLNVFVYANPYTCENINFSTDEENLCNFLKSKKIKKKYNVDLIKSQNGQIDKLTLKLFKPKMLSKHKANEKKANNTLLKHIKKINNHLKIYNKVYTKAETKYNVNKEIIAAILTKETWLGKIKPKHDAYTVFYSLYTKITPNTKRNKWLKEMGKKNIYYISQYCQKHKLSNTECKFKASYAGAVGFPQFMPMNFWLMTSYKNTKPNLNYMPDAIMSVGHFLHFHKFTKKIDYSKFKLLPKIEKEWYRDSFKNKKLEYFTSASNSYNLKRYTKKERKKIKYINKYIKKILRYNHSMNYALGVLRIAYETNKLQ